MSKAKGAGLREQVRSLVWRRRRLKLNWKQTSFIFFSPVLLGCLQDLKTLDVNKLTPLSPEVISRQATINIGELSSSPSTRFWSSQGDVARSVVLNSWTGNRSVEMMGWTRCMQQQ
jgi:hypothetical protein